jgi:hypothetical protein
MVVGEEISETEIEAATEAAMVEAETEAGGGEEKGTYVLYMEY